MSTVSSETYNRLFWSAFREWMHGVAALILGLLVLGRLFQLDLSPKMQLCVCLMLAWIVPTMLVCVVLAAPTPRLNRNGIRREKT